MQIDGMLRVFAIRLYLASGRRVYQPAAPLRNAQTGDGAKCLN
jgi:hypothetical protein